MCFQLHVLLSDDDFSSLEGIYQDVASLTKFSMEMHHQPQTDMGKQYEVCLAATLHGAGSLSEP